MAVTIIYLLFNIIFMYSVFTFLDNFLNTRRVSGRVLAFAYVLYYVVTSMFYFKTFNIILNVAVHLGFCFVIGFLYRSSILKRILAAIFIYILIIASDEFTLILLSIVSNSSYRAITGGTYLTCFGIMISMTVLLAMVKLVKPLFCNYDYDYELPRTYWLAIFLIPSGSIYILHSFNVQYINGGIKDLSFILTTVCILFAINILIFYLYNKLIKDESLKYENILLQQQNISYENQAILIQEFQRDLHDQKHEMKDYFAVIERMAKCGQTDELLEYISTHIEMTKEIESSFYCGNVIIDTLINSNLYLANRQNTKFSTDVTLSQPLEINPVHLTIILCNLLNNALEACAKSANDKRNIHITLTYDMHVLSITVTNTYDPKNIDIQNGVAHTTKTDKTIHGIGLKRVKTTVEKYNGTFTYYTKNSEEDSYFIAEAMLYL